MAYSLDVKAKEEFKGYIEGYVENTINDMYKLFVDIGTDILKDRITSFLLKEKNNE